MRAYVGYAPCVQATEGPLAKGEVSQVALHHPQPRPGGGRGQN